MLVLQRDQRLLLAETLRDIGNIAAAAMIFGQFLGEQPFSVWIAIAGMAAWIGLVACAVVVAGRRAS